MAEISNKDRISAAYKIWHETKGQSVETWLEFCSPTMTFLSSAMGRPGMEFSKPCTCIEDVRGYFEGLSADWDMIHYTVDQIIGDGDMLAAVGKTAWRHKTTGQEFEVAKADAWTFENGKAVRFAEHYDSEAILAALNGGGA
ncbi:MAG: nuclear transport factor 2 family protein [Pseudomonadota bacterium]